MAFWPLKSTLATEAGADKTFALLIHPLVFPEAIWYHTPSDFELWISAVLSTLYLVPCFNELTLPTFFAKREDPNTRL